MLINKNELLSLADVRDADQYLHSIGMTNVAMVQCQARIGQSDAKKEGSIKQAQAEEVRVQAEYKNKVQVNNKNNLLNLLKFSRNVLKDKVPKHILSQYDD